MKNSVAVILAGGKGTRMKSDLPKVLHKIAGREMILYSLEVAKNAGFEKVILLVGYKHQEIESVVGDKTCYAYQPRPLGTGDAAYRGVKNLESKYKNTLVVNGDDSAFYNPNTLKNIFLSHIKTKSTITFAVTNLANPTGIGRVLRNKKGQVIKIVEEKDTTDNEKKIKECNIGLYVFNTRWLCEKAPKIKKSPSGEYYIVDLVEMALKEGKKVSTYVVDVKEWHGVNTQEQLIEANNKMSIYSRIYG